MRGKSLLQMRNVIRATLNRPPPPPPPPPPSAAALFSSISAAKRVRPPPAAAATADVDEDDDDMSLLRKAPVTVSSPGVLQPRVVIYDGVCHLCHTGVKQIIRADKYGKIKFCCLQSKAAEPYMSICGVEREDVLRRFIFIEGLGQYHQASTAALKVLSYLPFPYSALSSLLIIPTPVRDAIYDYIAKRRYDWFGKEEDCLVLRDPELLERFIDREEILERRQSDI